MTQSLSVNENLVPLIGEFAWHSLVEDPRIEGESKRHFDLVTNVLNKHGGHLKDQPLHILEIACYAHITGYELEEKINAKVTLFELSRHALQTGQKISRRLGKKARPILASGDFHQLPFEDNAFNVVFICSALHHTWRYQEVLKEMMRVLAPGGLLFFENEPTKRDCCFYKFRCNRLHDFIPLEKKLDELGIIKTVAEPFLGSRPEMLFDMVENQTIPLNELLETIAAECDLQEISLFPEACMGVLEQQWLANRVLGQVKMKEMIYKDLKVRVDMAASFLDEKAKGMGFGLPADRDLDGMADWVSNGLAQLPVNANLFEFRQKLSVLFGAPIQMVGRKRAGETIKVTGQDMEDKRNRFMEKWPVMEGVYNTFPEAIREILGQTSLVPDIQNSHPEALKSCFPSEDWTTTQGDFELIALENLNHQLLSIVNKKNTATIVLPDLDQGRQTGLFILRFFCHVEGDHYFRIKLLLNEETIYEYAAFAAENILVKQIINKEQLKNCRNRLAVAVEAVKPDQSEAAMKIAVSYLGYFHIDRLIH